MINLMVKSLKKSVIIGISLVMLLLPASPVLAAEDTNATAVDNTSNQAASTGQIAEAVPPSPPTTEPPATPALDEVPPVVGEPTPITPPVDTVPTPAPEPPICSPTPVDPLVQGNPNADVVNNTVVNNCLNSDANSGNANVSGSNGGGNATSGNADVQATLLNLLQSVTNLGGGGLSTFMQNVYGDTNGDLHIDPSALATILGGGNACGCNDGMSTSTTSQINNDLNLNATSGDATVEDSRRGGNALTGNASVIANLVNIINTIASAGQSFLGTINIYGNLNGNILLPNGWLDGLLGSGSPAEGGSGGNLDTDSTQSINNNINQTANSGSATVENNRRGGDATTGDAANNLNIINMANRQIVGGNVLLVFVNVLGTWYGVIMDAPEGQNTAVLGGDITQNSIGCGCGLSGDISSNSQINNNINLTATSGNALVTGNRRGGNATSGDATTSLNLANIINSQISLSNWFGILFINVFGTWNGSLGEELPVVATPESGGSGTPQIFSVTAPPTGGSGGSYQYRQTTVQEGDTDSNDQSDTDTLGATTGGGGSGPTVKASWLNKALIAGISSCACFFLMGLIGKRRKHHEPIENLPEMIFPSI